MVSVFFLLTEPDRWYIRHGHVEHTTRIVEKQHYTLNFEVLNCRVMKSSYETELRKMASHFELLT